MKKILFSLLSVLPLFASAAQNYNPRASDAAIVVHANARFTVLTDRLIRMEWAEDGFFEDRASLAIVNRNLPVPSFKVIRNGESLTIKTNAVTLTYTGSESFCEDNLKVTFKLNGRVQEWHPGKDDSANLLGTSRTLDKCNGFGQLNPGDPMEQGIISRDGWAIVDESSRHVLEKNNSSIAISCGLYLDKILPIPSSSIARRTGKVSSLGVTTTPQSSALQFPFSSFSITP